MDSPALRLSNALAWILVFALLVGAQERDRRNTYDLGAIHPTGKLSELRPHLPDWADIDIPDPGPFLDVQVRSLVEFVDYRLVASLCDGPALACAVPATQTIIAPNPCAYPFDTYARILCHEKAHLAGWENRAEHNRSQ